jgi:hypothetical protein
MRKGLIVLLVAVVALAFAMPAAADTKISGFYRAKAYISNFNNSGATGALFATDAPTNAYVEQRFRVKFDFGNENVKAVWFLESDMIWGDSAGGAAPGAAARNVGGALGGDKVQTETKNIYIWFKLPNTSLDFTVGLQNQSDDYAGIIYGGADMAGIFLNGKYEPITWKLGWAKLYENNSNSPEDMTLYYSSVKFVPAKDAKLGVNFYFLQNETNKAAGTLPGSAPSTGISNLPYANNQKVYMPGIDGSFKVGPAVLSGFLMYQFGEFEAVNSANKSVDINAWMFDLRADMNLGPGKFFFEGLYLSGGDNTANEWESPVTLSTNTASPGGNSFYSRTNSILLMNSPDTIGTSQCLLGCSGPAIGGSQDPGNNGRGMWLVALGYSMPFGPKLKGDANFNYLSASELLQSDKLTNDNRGEDMGMELNAQLTYNIMKGLDVSLVGAYAWLGEFYRTPAGDDPDDIYTTYAKINYAF